MTNSIDTEECRDCNGCGIEADELARGVDDSVACTTCTGHGKRPCVYCDAPATVFCAGEYQCAPCSAMEDEPFWYAVSLPSWREMKRIALNHTGGLR